MTLAAVWVEGKEVGNQPLCFASDSRTKPGPIDGVTKVLLFGREDIAGVWAGDYRYAALLASHLDAVFTASETMRRRDVDVALALRRAVSTVETHLTTSITPNVPTFQQNTDAQTPERTVILVGGYSIREDSHIIFRLEWSLRDRKWRARVDRMDPQKIIFIGDERTGASQVARRARTHRDPDADDWQMEPLVAIHNACEDKNKDTIGGRPQLVKAYMHGSTRPYGFIDPHDGSVSVRSTLVDRRAANELALSGRLIDLGTYRLNSGSYATHRLGLDR